MDLNLEPGTYSTLIELTNDNLFVNCFVINLIDSTPVVEPPVEDEGDKKEEAVSNPTIRTQVLNCNLDLLENSTIKDVKFDGTNLKYIYINDKLISDDNSTNAPVDKDDINYNYK